MQLYIYAKSGHSFGLENIRRASALYNMLKDCDPTLCAADYRAATFAKQNLGTDKSVGVDTIGNMANVMKNRDILIYDDSGEASETMQNHMQEYCKELFKVGRDIPYDIVDETFFEKSVVSKQKVIFFADDDYATWFFNFIQTGSKKDIPFIKGHYFFLKNEDKTAEYFSEVLEEDEYIDTIKQTKYLLTASVHSALESPASGNCPVFFKRGDKETTNFELIEKYNIPVIEGENFDQLVENFEKMIKNYPATKTIKKYDTTEVKGKIEKILKLFEGMIKPALGYKF